MKKRWLLGLVFVILALALGIIFSSYWGRKQKEELHKMPEVRSPDIRTAIEIPEVPYLVIPNELVVLLKEGETVESFAKTIKDSEVKIVGQIPTFRIAQVEIPASKREALKAELEKNPLVEVVVYQGVFRSNVKFNDPALNNDDPWDDWGIQAINAEAAWEITRGSPEVIVAVVDCGILFSHEELKDKIVLPGSVFTDDGSHVGNAEDLFHGTYVAIIAVGAGNNGVGTSGIAPGSRLMPVQVGGFSSDVLAGIAYAVEMGAKVINVSMAVAYLEYKVEDYQDPSRRMKTLSYFLGVRQRDREFTDKVFAIVEAAGVTIVFGAGNDNIPGDFSAWIDSPFTLGVGAVGLDNQEKLAPANFSNYGYMVRVSAPGMDIYSGNAEPGGSGYVYRKYGGTSAAAPYVTGLAALIVSVNPDLTPLEIRQVIIASAYADTPLDLQKVPWFQDEREANQEMNLWRRALLLIFGKDENLLLHSMAQEFMLSLIRPEYNAIWQGGIDKAVGGFIDARAALEMAKSGSFRKRFAEFSEEDEEKAEQLKPEQLLQVYDMLKYARRYAGSQNVSPFTLELKEPFERLQVIRASKPEGDYSEWLEYVQPGIYRHLCKFRGEDYSRGLLRLQSADNAMLIKNRRAKEDISYPLAEKSEADKFKAYQQFYTIAGGSKPNEMGKLIINYIGPEGKPEEKEFYVYPQGVEPEAIEIVYSEHTGSVVEMITGSYDIKIRSLPAIWIRGIEIEKDKLRELEAGGYGKILITGSDVDGEPIRTAFWMIAPEGKEDWKANVLATGRTNEPTDVLEGNYYVYVSQKPPSTYDDVRVKRGQTTEIQLPQWGRLEVRGKDAAGKPLKKTFWIHTPEDREPGHSVTAGHVNEAVDLPPGIYDIWFGRNNWIEGIEIRANEIKVIDLPPP